MNELDSCRHQVRPHLSAHLDGQPIPLRVRLWIALHLRVCPACQLTRRSLEATRDALRALRDVEPGDDRL
jgi:hypothetical protein